MVMAQIIQIGNFLQNVRQVASSKDATVLQRAFRFSTEDRTAHSISYLTLRCKTCLQRDSADPGGVRVGGSVRPPMWGLRGKVGPAVLANPRAAPTQLPTPQSPEGLRWSRPRVCQNGLRKGDRALETILSNFQKPSTKR